HDGLPPVQPRNVMVDLLFPRQVEEVLFENFCRSTEMLADLVGQRALFINRPFERRDHGNSEVTEQPGKILQVCLDLGTTALVDLRQEKVLEVNHQAPAIRGENALGHRVLTCAQSRGSTAKPLCTTLDISKYALPRGAKTLCNTL